MRVTQDELQEDLQRFATSLTARTTYELHRLEQSSNPEISREALRMDLLYLASAFDIVSSPIPEIALLDMIVFVRLSRMVLEDYWIPKLYGEAGRDLVEAFQKSETELWLIADKVLSESQKRLLVSIIDDWRRNNPTTIAVEGLRLTEFAERAGALAEERARETSGLLSSVRSATQSADEALLLAKRGMFLLNRLPFLLRMQARLAAREIVGDTVKDLSRAEGLVGQAKELEPLVHELPSLVTGSYDAAHEARLLVADVTPLVPTREAAAQIQASLASANELTASARELLEEVRAMTPSKGELTTAKREVDSAAQRGLLYLVLLGGAWSVLWWGGYFVVKRRLARRG